MKTIVLHDSPELVILVQKLQKTLKPTGQVVIGELENRKRIDFRTVYVFRDGHEFTDNEEFFYSMR